MDNIFSGLVGIALFAAFVVGLAESIMSGPAGMSGLPFAIIVGGIILMAGYALYEDIRADAREGAGTPTTNAPAKPEEPSHRDSV